jgi:hypothetical protein
MEDFNEQDDLNEKIRLHAAGATVIHKSSFADLPSWQNTEELSQDFIDSWAIPFYMSIGNTGEAWINQLVEAKEKITKGIVLKLLGDFNWRTRQTGAFFAAIKNYTDLTDIIGIHLLKSEVCYAGQTYAYTFASFNTDKCIVYLTRHLTYYLAKPELWFDQQAAMEALTYLDKVNNTNLVSMFTDNWIKFIANKSNWNKEISTDRLLKQLQLIEKVRDSN